MGVKCACIFKLILSMMIKFADKNLFQRLHPAASCGTSERVTVNAMFVKLDWSESNWDSKGRPKLIS